MHRGDKIVLITPTHQSQSDEQVRVEARILFRLELPSHKSIGVKAKQGKTVAEVILITMLTIVLISTLKVLGPILLQYGWTVPEVEIYLDQEGTNHGTRVDLAANVCHTMTKTMTIFPFPEIDFCVTGECD